MDMAEPEAPVPPPPPSRRASRWPIFVMVLGVVIFAELLLGLYWTPEWARRWRRQEEQMAAEAIYLRRQAELKAESEAADARLENLDRRLHLVSLGFREVARKVAPLVVHIGNEVEAPDPASGRAFYDLDQNRHFLERAEGSGILVQPGLILTNEHVVAKAERLRVTFASGRYLLAGPDQVAVDHLSDLAIIRLPEASGTPPNPDYAIVAEFANSDRDVQVGDWVLAAGSPFGLKQSVTAGIVSAKGRVEIGILNQVELLQTDAAINPGNSGGPLFDQRGRVVGINVAIASEKGRNEGVAFAIPSNTVREVLDQLIERGEVVRGFLGIGMQEIPEDIGTRLGLGTAGGVLVSLVDPDFAAGRAGMQRGDIIVRFNGELLETGKALNQLRMAIARTTPGATVPIEVLRRHRRVTIQVEMDKRPAKLS